MEGDFEPSLVPTSGQALMNWPDLSELPLPHQQNATDSRHPMGDTLRTTHAHVCNMPGVGQASVHVGDCYCQDHVKTHLKYAPPSSSHLQGDPRMPLPCLPLRARSGLQLPGGLSLLLCHLTLLGSRKRLLSLLNTVWLQGGVEDPAQSHQSTTTTSSARKSLRELGSRQQ